MALLRINSPKIGTHIFPLDSDQVTIGREPGICSIVLNSDVVSRCHALITRTDTGYTLADQNSRNGTRLNGIPLKQVTLLHDGDRITLGDIELRFDAEERTRTLDDSVSDTNSVILTDDDNRQPINVMSQIDLRSLQNPSPIVIPETLEGRRDLILELCNKIKAISALMKDFSRGYTSQELLPQFLENVLTLFPFADFACVLERDNKTGRPRVSESKARDSVRQFRISRSVANYVFENNAAILSENLGSDDRFETSESIYQSQISSIMAVPIPNPDAQGPERMIQVDSRTRSNRFSKSDLDRLLTIANLLAMYYKAVRLQEVKNEMELAKRVQESYLPTAIPELEGYEFSHLYKPKDEVGGDFFDYIPLPGGRLAVLVADVSGHGVSGALVMAKLSSDARFFLLSEPSLPDVMAKLNASVCEHFVKTQKYITMALVVIDPKNQRFSLLNAAHVFPFRKRGERVDIIGEDHNGSPLGWNPEARYEEYSFDLEPGDFLVLMTDGITETHKEHNATKEGLGMAGVQKFLRAETTDSAQKMGEKTLAAARRFAEVANAEEQEDDQCIVVIKRCH